MPNTMHIPNLKRFTHIDYAVDMINVAAKTAKECNPLFPANLQTARFHLERAYSEKEITSQEYIVLDRDITTLARDFFKDCRCSI